jgi:type II secretory pathway component GspD/PulD (secretin)
MMTYEQNIDSIINRKDIKIGNSSYSLKDMFITPVQAAYNMVQDSVLFVVDPLEKQLTQEEKEAFHQKCGMSYGSYMRFQQMGELLKKKAAEVVGYSNSLAKDLSDDRRRLDEIAENVFDSESTIQQQQINNAVMTIMAQDIKTQANLLGDIARQIALNSGREVLAKQAMEDEVNMNKLNYSESLLKMLDEMPASEYR